VIVATNPEPDPIADEGNRLLREDPELLHQLEDFERDYPQGKVKLVDHDEVRRRVNALGTKVDD
jgi:hypothetical protein